MQAIEHRSRFGRDAEREHRAAVAIPRAHQRFAEPLTIAFRRDHGVGAPGALDLESLQRDANRQRRIVADDGRPFARDPDIRLAGGVVGIAAMLPVPAEAMRFGRVGALRPSIQRLDAAAVFGLVAIDLGHEMQAVTGTKYGWTTCGSCADQDVSVLVARHLSPCLRFGVRLLGAALWLLRHRRDRRRVVTSRLARRTGCRRRRRRRRLCWCSASSNGSGCADGSRLPGADAAPARVIRGRPAVRRRRRPAARRRPGRRPDPAAITGCGCCCRMAAAARPSGAATAAARPPVGTTRMRSSVGRAPATGGDAAAPACSRRRRAG